MKNIWKVLVVVAVLLLLLVLTVNWDSATGLWADPDTPCPSKDPIGEHPDGSKIWHQIGDVVEDSLCTEDGWVLNLGEEEEIDEPVSVECEDTTEFGPEQHFPGKSAKGPAIAEVWNPNTNFCALVRVNDGETLSWDNRGSWFQADTVDDLDARFPGYMSEYEAKPGNANCQVFDSVEDMP